MSTPGLIKFRWAFCDFFIELCHTIDALESAVSLCTSVEFQGYLISSFYSVQLLLKGASERGAKRIRVHILTDGRDVLDGSSVGFVETLENDLSQLREKGIDAQIASGGGRMYVTMDRYEVKHLGQPSTVIRLAFWLTILLYFTE